LTTDEWTSGKNADPILVSMDPENSTSLNYEGQKLKKVEAVV